MNKYGMFSKADTVNLEEAKFHTCGRKRTYTTEEEAAAQKGQSAYKCPYCDGWHRTAKAAKLAARVRRTQLRSQTIMKFKLQTSGSFYTEKQKNRLEKLGFTFEPNEGYPHDRPFYMTGGEPEVEFRTLGELVDFRNKWGDIILTANGVIEIYDNYRE